ncbi:hypothetical protein [Paenibacillus polymyxa]|uniref:hypothetical protein n=1 Tax=Paenibacillus polymyxa TaxID=1406 RepID=UPI0022226F93|nr:hypothetical protein [Paenibacillus polymyxa]
MVRELTAHTSSEEENRRKLHQEALKYPNLTMGEIKIIGAAERQWAEFSMWANAYYRDLQASILQGAFSFALIRRNMSSFEPSSCCSDECRNECSREQRERLC